MSQYTKPYIPILITTIVATGAYNAGEPVNYAGLAASANDRIVGIAMEDVATADVGTGIPVTSVINKGEVTVKAGGAITTAGHYVKCAGSGKFVTNTTTLDNTCVGIAKTTASGDGVDFLMELL